MPAARTPTPRNSLREPRTSASTSNGYAKVASGLTKSPGHTSCSKSTSKKAGRDSSSKLNSPSEPAAPSSASPVTPKISTPPSTVSQSSKTLGPKTSIRPSPSPESTKPKATRIDSALSHTSVTKPSEPELEQESPYVGPHIGDPCTANALDHLLECSHRVITMRPEDCATNCHRDYSAYPNARNLDQPFACLVCLATVQQAKHAWRVKSFEEELTEVAKAMMKPRRQQWIKEKIAIMEPAWRDLETDVVTAQSWAGRLCHPLNVEQEIEVMVMAVLGKRLWAIAEAQEEAARAKVEEETWRSSLLWKAWWTNVLDNERHREGVM